MACFFLYFTQSLRKQYQADQLSPTGEKRAAAAQEMRSLQNFLSNSANAHERHKDSILLLAGLSIKLNLQVRS
jgi:hypothetical protein